MASALTHQGTDSMSYLMKAQEIPTGKLTKKKHGGMQTVVRQPRQPMRVIRPGERTVK